MTFKKKKIAIVWANPYNRNLGVGALAYSSLALINDLCNNNNISAEFTFLGSSIGKPDKLEIGDRVIEFDNILGIDFSNWKSYAKMLLKPKKYETRKILSFDLVLDMGEGDSFADIYGDKRFNRIYSSKLFFNFFNIPQVLLPQTIGPFSQNSKEKKAISIMKKLSLVLSRDKKSYDYTAKFLPGTKIAELVDIAFYMPFSKVKYNNGKINVGINVSGLLWNGGYTGKNQFNMKTDYKAVIFSLFDYFTKIDEVQLHIVSHVIPEHQPVESDYLVGEELKRSYPQAILAPVFKNPIEAKSYISGLDFFTGARMHACIAAFSSGVPVVPMAYSRKFNGLFTDTLKFDDIADCVNEENEIVFNKIIGGFKRRSDLSFKVSDSIVNVVDPRLQILKQILLKVIKAN